VGQLSGLEIEAVVLTPDELKKSSGGRKPFDAASWKALHRW
jgi:hypothetical protein